MEVIELWALAFSGDREFLATVVDELPRSSAQQTDPRGTKDHVSIAHRAPAAGPGGWRTAP